MQLEGVHTTKDFLTDLVFIGRLCFHVLTYDMGPQVLGGLQLLLPHLTDGIPWASLVNTVSTLFCIYTSQAFIPINSKDLAEASWTAWRLAISWTLSALAVGEAWDGTGRGNSGTSGKALSGNSLLGTNWSKSPHPHHYIQCHLLHLQVCILD